MADDDLISTVKKFSVFNSKSDDIHGFPHVSRVYELCLQIGKRLNANLTTLGIAALLHDVGRIKEKTDEKGRNHADISAEIALNFLKNQNHSLSQKDIENIINAIRAHSFSNNVTPDTIEAKILSDSDKLDALGAIGLYRTIAFTIQRGGALTQVIHHLDNKILKLKDQMHLDTSKKIAELKEEIIMDFYRKIKDGL